MRIHYVAAFFASQPYRHLRTDCRTDQLSDVIHNAGRCGCFNQMRPGLALDCVRRRRKPASQKLPQKHNRGLIEEICKDVPDFVVLIALGVGHRQQHVGDQPAATFHKLAYFLG